MKFKLKVKGENVYAKVNKVNQADSFGKYSVIVNRWEINNYPGCKDNEHMHLFLRDMERYCNKLLEHKGYVSLYDVYQVLGLDINPWYKDRLEYYKRVGWVRGEEELTYIDFGLNKHIDVNLDFFNCMDDKVLLDFNAKEIIETEEESE